MLSPAFCHMSTMQWASMPSDTNGVEALNKCSIDHSKRTKSLEACLEYTYRQDKKTTLEHLFAYSGLPLSFQRMTLEKSKQRAKRQNKARSKATAAKERSDDDDDIGLNGIFHAYLAILHSVKGCM